VENLPEIGEPTTVVGVIVLVIDLGGTGCAVFGRPSAHNELRHKRPPLVHLRLAASALSRIAQFHSVTAK
jgi:hypothetical protein